MKLLLSIVLLCFSYQAQALFLSTSSAATLGGLSFRSGDIVAYDPGTGQARLAWAGSFVDTENPDALQALPGGRFLISTRTDAQLTTGLACRDGDLVSLDPVNGVGSLFFSEDRFGTDEDIDAAAFAVPGPGALLLVLTG